MQAEGIVRVRIRGIYATALTKMLLDAGFLVVQASDVIAHRFGIPQNPAPADVTVKDEESDRSTILVIGYPAKARKVLEVLRSRLPYSFYWISPVNVYSTVAVEVREENGKCIAELNGAKLEVQGVQECSGRVVGYVVKAPVKPWETGRLVPGVRVVGDYAMVYWSPSQQARITFSEHIRSMETRAELITASTPATSRGLSVHWRSSAQYAQPTELLEELQRLAERAEELRRRAQSGELELGVHSEGELVALVTLSLPDKMTMDEIRSEVVPTVPYHHSMKSVGDEEMSRLTDFAEKVVEKGVDPEKPGIALVEWLVEKLERRRRGLRILHVRPLEEPLEIGPCELREAEVRSDGSVRMTLIRTVRSPGVYDALGVEKEPGDVIETTVDTSEWRVVHRYYSSNGDLKGVYININTPPEVTANGLRYLDLEVDVVEKPGEKPRVVDLEKLAEAYRRGIVGAKLARRALEEAASAAGVPVEELARQAQLEEILKNPQD